MRQQIQRLIAACRVGLGPREFALTVALGTLCACFPILGLATPLCVVAGIVFRLNHPLLQALNALSSPAYLPVVFGLMKLGDHFLGPSGLRPTVIAGHALLGWCLVAPLWVPAVFAATLLVCAATASLKARIPVAAAKAIA